MDERADASCSGRISWCFSQEGDDEDWDIQRYLADRDRDARAESADGDGDEHGYREQADGDDENDDEEGGQGEGNDGEDQGEGGSGQDQTEDDGQAAAEDGVASARGKKAGLTDEEVQGAVDKMEQVRVAT